MTKREKLLTRIIVFLVTIIIVLIAFMTSELKHCSKNTITDADINNYKYSYIGLDEYKELITDSKPNVIYVARPTCGYCTKQDPILKEVAVENDLKIYYLNTDELTSSEIQELTTTHKSLNELATPTFLITNDKSISASKVGYLEKTELMEFFKQNGIME